MKNRCWIKVNVNFCRKERILTEERERYQRLNQELEARKKEIIDRAKTEASTLLKETNREIEKTIRHIRENKAEKKETRKVRQGLVELADKVQPQAPQNPPTTGSSSKKATKSG